ncbi:MAG TPA: TonB family protein [Usitatibacteraceae bacterium]|nr:TonB family protein [Usitatibacteraceae bacterium]
MLDKPRAIARDVRARFDARLDAVAAMPPPPVALSIQRALAVSVPMQSSALFSVAFHLVLILGVGVQIFDPNKFVSPHNAMDVVLVNAKSTTKPTKADALAQANLDGGGNTDEKRRAATPLPAIDQTPAQNPVEAQKKVKQLEQELNTLMTQAKAAAKVMQAEVSPEKSGEPKPVSAAELMQKSIEIARLEAQIAREYSAYQQRPKRHFVGGRTQEYRFAAYVDQWRQKIERVGNLNYPEAARARGIRGNVQVTVAIKANGEVEGIEIHTQRADRILKDAVKRIVTLSSPFAPFPSDFRADTDVLHITRTWIFGESLTAEAGR